jgi:hypothetical protein
MPAYFGTTIPRQRLRPRRYVLPAVLEFSGKQPLAVTGVVRNCIACSKAFVEAISSSS